MLVKLISRTFNDKIEARRFVSLFALSGFLSVGLFVSAAAKVKIQGKPGGFETIQQAVDVVIKFADKYPAFTHLPFVAFVVNALKGAWPCQPQR